MQGASDLILEEGETVLARRLVVASRHWFVHLRARPNLSGLPCSLASHTAEHRELRKFAGKQVLVIGSGQSALESAALLHESGAESRNRSPGASDSLAWGNSLQDDSL